MWITKDADAARNNFGFCLDFQKGKSVSWYEKSGGDQRSSPLFHRLSTQRVANLCEELHFF